MFLGASGIHSLCGKQTHTGALVVLLADERVDPPLTSEQGRIEKTRLTPAGLRLQSLPSLQAQSHDEPDPTKSTP